jgi:Arc/MetJ-type ribon-helix-helix transcriptional regulator
MKSSATSDTLVPPAMLPEIRAVAQEEHRDPSDVVREALERYMADREWNKIFAYGEERARAMGLTEEDVPRLIAEYRREKRQGQG